MNIRIFLRILGVFVAAGLIFGLWKVLNQWDYERIGTFEARRNNITGIVQIKEDSGQWASSFSKDRYAPGVLEADLKNIRLTDGKWDENGILVGRAKNTSTTKAVTGRLGILIHVYYPDGRRLKDRTLRVTVNWPANSSTPFIIDTNLPTPASNQKWTVNLVTTYNTDGSE